MLGADPEAHLRARRLLSPFFSTEVIKNLSDYVKTCVYNLLNEAVGKKEFDIVNDVAIPLTENVIAHFLGLNGEDVAALRECTGENKYLLNYFQVLEEYFANYIERIETKPFDNFCNRLLRGNGDDRFTKEEVVSLMKLFWVAGTTTTSMLISTSTFLLMHHPQLMFEIQNEPNLLPQFIEESLRFDAPEQTAWRITTEEVEIGGVLIPKNAAIRLCLGAANRDPKHYPTPGCLILRRNPKDHLSFGAGQHFCLGAMLSRLEARITLEVIISKFPTLRPVQKLNEVQYTGSSHFRAFEKMLVTVEEG